jgi:chorismate synthase
MRFLDAGESHGKQLTAIIEGVPSGFTLTTDRINEVLHKRQKGYGRGARMQIEQDQVEITSGVRFGKTIGSPITLTINNEDYKNWQELMSIETADYTNLKAVTKPRPGHADLSGGIKYNQQDLRNILERSSARETAIRVAVGAVAEQLLHPFAIQLFSHVTNIAGIQAKRYSEFDNVSLDQLRLQVASSEVNCLDVELAKEMVSAIERASDDGDTLGGIVEVVVLGLPVGLGSHVHWDRKLDANLARAIMSIQGFKGVEIGIGYQAAALPGSKVHDPIKWKDRRFYRPSNNAGGIEGGISNGEPVIITGVMKPIPTLYNPLSSVDIESKETFLATIERSDICAVPAASIVAHYVTAWEIAAAFFAKFSGDSLAEVRQHYNSYLKQIGEY